MLIDLHTHTSISSGCSRLLPEELIQGSMSTPLDAICVTEHSTLKGAEIARAAGEKLKFPVFRGIEARTDLGDMLVFGWYKDVPEGTPLADLCDEVLGAGGVIFAAHPFYTMGGWNLYTALQHKGLDLLKDWNKLPVLQKLTGIETINGNVDDKTNSYAHALSIKLGVPGIGGSDAHSQSMIAKAATRFNHPIQSETELVEALKEGCFEPIRLRY